MLSSCMQLIKAAGYVASAAWECVLVLLDHRRRLKLPGQSTKQEQLCNSKPSNNQTFLKDDALPEPHRTSVPSESCLPHLPTAPITETFVADAIVTEQTTSSTSPRGSSDDMPGKTNGSTGNDPVENGVNGTKDVEMKDDAPASLKGGKGKKAKDGDEEMTVVVPPSKGQKLAGLGKKDGDGDVAMDGEAVEGEDDGAVKVDPVVKAVAGMIYGSVCPYSIINHFLCTD